MKYAILILIVTFIGCKPVERIIHTENRTEYRDSVTHVILKRDTIIVTEKVVIRDNNPVTLRPITAKTEFSEAMAWVENSLLKLKIYNLVDSIPVEYRYEIRYITRVEVKEVPAPLPWWVGWSIVLLVVALVFTLIFKR